MDKKLSMLLRIAFTINITEPYLKRSQDLLKKYNNNKYINFHGIILKKKICTL